ncbi:LysR family transcriptional regulator [Escherichia coli]|uniref:LysR family transcriptional regulator n=1 Tax=Escherichia coli TaxID=562 RepID=A0A377E261_ECOLX|nr:LysR family transcriptional regulator [Escherichia coli]
MPDYMVREAMAQSLLVTRQIHNPRQDSRMLLATQHSATGQVTQWIKKQFAPNGILTGSIRIYCIGRINRCQPPDAL